MNEQMHKSIVRELDSKAADLETRYSSILALQREKLLNTSAPGRHLSALPWAAAAAVVIAAGLWSLQSRIDQQPNDGELPAEAHVDVELLQSEDFEVAENLEFYLWLESQLDEGDAG